LLAAEKFELIYDRLEAIESFNGAVDNKTQRQRREESNSLLVESSDTAELEALLLHRATSLLLTFLASEMSELASSCWAMMMLPVLYDCPNKQWFYTICDFDDGGFEKALYFSSADFFLELVTFVAMLIFLIFSLKIRVMELGVAYMKKQKLFIPILAISVTIPISSFTFFVMHTGVDPNGDFDPAKFLTVNINNITVTN